VRKPGRKALRAGKQRVLADHRTVAGKQYHAYFVALAKAFDLSAPLARLEASRVALRHLRWLEASAGLREAEAVRRNGKGRRPSAARIRSLIKIEQREDMKLSAALAALERLAPRRSALNGEGWPS
jgi:hypothetical protein